MTDETLLSSLVSAAAIELEEQIEDGRVFDDLANGAIEMLTFKVACEFGAAFGVPPDDDDWSVLLAASSVAQDIQRIGDRAIERARWRIMSEELDRRVRLGLVRVVPGDDGGIRYEIWRH